MTAPGAAGDTRPVVLITGGGSGIGAATARRLAGAYRVVICGRRPEPIGTVAQEIDGEAIALDIANPDSSRRLIARIIETHGRLDGLVLNADIIHPASVAEMKLEDWNSQLAVNLTSPFVMAQAALPQLLEAKGAIVTVSSVAAHEVGAGLAAYCASKAGVTLLTQTIAFECARHGLRANVVAPGWVRTEMADMEMEALGDKEGIEGAYRRVTRLVPSRRAAAPSEIAEAIAWLLSPAASAINGAVLTADGGGSIVSAGLTEFDTP